ncbi:hypothetical protein MRX96_007841 [Rhipicephalus microplus]
MTEKDVQALWYNGQIQHLAPLVLNLFNTARLRNVTKYESADFIFEVTPRGVMDAQVVQRSHSGMMIDHASGSSQYRVVLPKVLRSIFFPLVSSLMCSNFVIFPTAERALGTKYAVDAILKDVGKKRSTNAVYTFIHEQSAIRRVKDTLSIALSFCRGILPRTENGLLARYMPPPFQDIGPL